MSCVGGLKRADITEIAVRRLQTIESLIVHRAAACLLMVAPVAAAVDEHGVDKTNPSSVSTAMDAATRMALRNGMKRGVRSVGMSVSSEAASASAGSPKYGEFAMLSAAGEKIIDPLSSRVKVPIRSMLTSPLTS